MQSKGIPIRFLPTLLLPAVVLALIYGCDDSTKLSSTLSVGKPAPDVQLPTLAGDSVRLSDQRGKVVVLDFWATWCPPCVLSMPHLQELASDASLIERGMVVWAINSQEPLPAVRKFVDERGLTMPIPLDSGSASAAMGVLGLPTTVVVGRDGNVEHLILGFDPKKTPTELRSAVERALAKSPS